MKSIKEYTLQELCNLRSIIENLPTECYVSLDLNMTGDYTDIYEYIDNYEKDFFNVSDDTYNNIVGKIFINKDETNKFNYSKILKVVGFNPLNPIEFFYEEYIKSNNEWYQPDYNYLKEHINNNPVYAQYKNKPEVFVNIRAEEMYMLGKDGNLYVDETCGGDYSVFTPIDDEITFNLIKIGVEKKNDSTRLN